MKYFLLLFLIFPFGARSQSVYFPPNTGTTWDTLPPDSLDWCPERIDSLYDYLGAHNTDAFIVLKGGKMVLEKYYGSFTRDSVHYWASAGKSLTALLTGIAQEQGLLNINDSVSNSIGTGWTSAPASKEGYITIKNLLTMTSGLNDTLGLPCTNEDTSISCLRYLRDVDTRWAYHSGAYRKLQNVVSDASGLNYNVFTSSNVGNRIGMNGLWYNGVYYSTARSMARFGLLMLNKAIWNTDTLLHYTSYFNSMLNTSQSFNLSYGYLWWLNGKSSYMAPGTQFLFPGSLISNAPSDMICALGKNDQKIYIVPSQQLVVVRMGQSAYGTAMAFSPFDNILWGKIDSLGYGCETSVEELGRTNSFNILPNPAQGTFTVLLPSRSFVASVCDVTGRAVYTGSGAAKISVDCTGFPAGMYVVKVVDSDGSVYFGKVFIKQ